MQNNFIRMPLLQKLMLLYKKVYLKFALSASIPKIFFAYSPFSTFPLHSIVFHFGKRASLPRSWTQAQKFGISIPVSAEKSDTPLQCKTFRLKSALSGNTKNRYEPHQINDRGFTIRLKNNRKGIIPIFLTESSAKASWPLLDNS